MSRFVEGEQRSQLSLLPASLDEYVDAENPVRVVDVFIEELNLTELGFTGAAATGRPGYHPTTLLKIYLYGYLNRIQSSRRLEREANRNVELMWLSVVTGKLARSPPFPARHGSLPSRHASEFPNSAAKAYDGPGAAKRSHMSRRRARASADAAEVVSSQA